MSVSFETRIESYEVQPDGKIKISSLMKLLQKLAGDDLDDSSLSYLSLREKNIAFVLTKVTLQMYKDIMLYDNINITTHPRALRGATFLRDFIIRLNGDVAAYATSSWVLIDLEKRTILRPSALDNIGKIITSEEDTIILPDIRRKIELASLSQTNVRKVHYSQLDMNEHLNNTFYADFIFDSIPAEIHPSDSSMFFEINYKTEARLDDILQMHISSTSKRQIDFCAVNSKTDNICFSAYIDFDGTPVV